MRKHLQAVSAVALSLAACAPGGALAQNVPSPPAEAAAPAAARETLRLDKDWRFAFGHATDPSKDFGYSTRAFFFAKAGYGDGPAAVKFDDRAWRQLDLPHDWAVELPFDPRGDGNHGSKAVGRNFPENSIGWYRKTIAIPASDRGRRISLVFDGVYRDSVVWFNGHYIGREPSGYSSFRYDITDYINYGGPNVIAVRADATGEEGWFYEGAGIYRHVWLTKTDPLHVAQWGTFVSSEIKGSGADLTAQVTLNNDSRTAQTFEIEQQVYAPDGKLVAVQKHAQNPIDAAGSTTVTDHIRVDKPLLWSLETPQLYKLITLVRREGRVVDSYTTPFGIRSLVWDANNGVFLNGKHVELKGIDNHQDFAGVGVAAPDALIVWRLNRLKDIGVNAMRMSHNPPTPELLDAADRMGFLIIDEHRMMGTTPEIRDQMERMIRRDRNHPSVAIWSVGNEEWALEWSELGTRLADEMQWDAHRLDPTRRTTIATSGSGQGVSVAADVIGFNYRTQHHIDKFHADHPEKPSVMTEEGSTTATRGIYFDDREHVHLAAYDREATPGDSSSIEEGWRAVVARPFIAGMFVWTGFDYRGEPTPFGWPAISSQFGMLDTTGVIKDSGYYLKSVWTDAPMVHLLPHWNWAGKEGQTLDVWAYANTDEVELFLNGKSLGRQTLVKNSHLSWSVPYAPGALTAKGYRAGKLAATTTVETTGAPASVLETADRKTIKADGVDVSVITVNVADAKGRISPISDNLIRFDTQGPIRILGVGNGDPGSHEADRVADRYRYLAFGGWRYKLIDDTANRPETAADADTHNWHSPFQWLPPAERPAMTKALVIRGGLKAPALDADETLSILVPQLGKAQSVFFNGKPAALRAEGDGFVFDVPRAELARENSLTFVFETPPTGLWKIADDSQGGVNWAIVRIRKPAGPWQRKVFSGYAQVIVQSTGEAGDARVIATSDGLKPAKLNISVIK